MLGGLGLSLNELRGQGYDGASTISGEKSGVQKLIRDIQPKALYTHCAGHSLNLAIVSACTVLSVRNAIDSIKGFTLWIKASPKREALLKTVYQDTIQNTSSRSLLNVCITRWVENIDGWEQFSLCHPVLVSMCEVVMGIVSMSCIMKDGQLRTKEMLRHTPTHCYHLSLCIPWLPCSVLLCI